VDIPIALAADFILNLASESEEESSNDDEGIIATLATDVIVRKKTIDDVITRKQMTAWNFILYKNMYFYKLKLTCPKIFLKKILFHF
jgi:hypothetical protein